MQSETPFDTNQGLPPITPPSGAHLVQMFVVPGIIVGVIVGVLVTAMWLFPAVSNWLVTSPRTPQQFLVSIDNTNPEVRWRAASDLAQVLLRDEQLASDPRFALDMAQRLRQAINANAESEKRFAERLKREADGQTNDDGVSIEKQRAEVEGERNYALYLCSSLGNFTIPIGASLIEELAGKTEVAEPEALRLRRRQAVWALVYLGNHLKRFEKLSPERRAEVLEQLREEAKSSGDRGIWAKNTLDYLESGKGLTVSQTLIDTAADEDPYLRKQSAMALAFWGGPRAEEVLRRLLADDGRGAELALDPERDKDSSVVAKRYQREVRYQALLALAWLGSPLAVEHADMLKEMLDVEKQQQVAESDVAVATVMGTLRALTMLHQKLPKADLSAFKESVANLSQSPNVSIRTEALRTMEIYNPS